MQENGGVEENAVGTVYVRLDLSYDGASFNGWGVQPNVPTVQGTIEAALEVLFRRPVRLTVAGRTDSGVHARGQVASFTVSEAEWRGLSRGKNIAPDMALQRRLMGVLAMILEEKQGTIVINAVSRAPYGFNARFSALWRRYSYRIVDDPQQWDPTRKQISWWLYKSLDVEKMNEGARLLIGCHDFFAYCKKRPKTTTIRTLQDFRFERRLLDKRRGERPGEDIVATIRADAFCHNMVRALVFAAVKVGWGEQKPSWLKDRLEAKIRDKHYALAPAHPLIFEEVAYPEDSQVAVRAQVTRARRTDPPS